MYKIPLEFNISSLDGERITQIAFGLNYITFVFNKGFIQFSGSFSINFGNQELEYNDVYPIKNDFGLLQLLEKSIIKVLVNDLRNILTLQFEGGAILNLIGDDYYESYRIKIMEQEIII